MKAMTPRVGTKFVDCFGSVSPAQARALATDEGVGAVLRYENMGAEEMEMLLGEGLLVGLVVTAPMPGFQPSSALAQEKFSAAVEHFVGLDVPDAVSVIVDLETMGGDAGDRIAYANGAAAVIVSAKLDPAGYFGAGVGLTSAELTALVVNRYLKSLSRVTDANGVLAEPACGWAGHQIYPGNQKLACGLLVDFGMFGTDYEGRSFTLVGG